MHLEIIAQQIAAEGVMVVIIPTAKSGEGRIMR